jgi:Na+/proline symporter
MTYSSIEAFISSVVLFRSHISGITLLGVPSEIYANGTQYWLFVIPAITVSLTIVYIYLPVFYELQLTSSFTYLEKRYDRSVRLTASLIYAFQMIIYIPIVIYVPALAFSQVTGINLHIVSPIICAICIFYTTVGGLRAVIWTDTLQFVMMLFAICAVIGLGVIDVGGFGNMWQTAEKGGRLVFFK